MTHCRNIIPTGATSIIIALAGIAPGASAASRHGCAARTGTCMPKTLSGSFSGEDADFTWHGTVSLKAHRQQTDYSYRGPARYTWKLKRAATWDGCTFTPSSGTITENVDVSVNFERSGNRGYGYAGGDGAGGATGGIQEVCPAGTEDSGMNLIDLAFAPGGFSKDLHKFAGSEVGHPYRFTWSFHGGY